MRKEIIIPAPQEFSLFRPAASKAKPFAGDIFEAISEEMVSIRDAEEERQNALLNDSDSLGSDRSDSSFLFAGVGGVGGGKKSKKEDGSKMVRSNERLFGSVSLSFFPVLW